MSVAINLTLDRLKDSFKHQAKVLNRKISDLQIVIGTRPEAEGSEIRVPVYYIQQDWDYENKEEKTYKELLGRADLLQGGSIAKSKFPERMKILAGYKKLEYEKLEIMVIPNDDEKNLRLGLAIFENKQHKENITIDYFFGE